MDKPPLFAGEITILFREMLEGAPDNSPNLGKPGRSEAVQKMLEKGARTLETPDTKDQGTNMWIANGQTKHKRGIKALKIGHCSA